MRDGASYWNDSATENGFERLAGRIEADVAIVGGGMAGVMAAAVMKERGLNVALVEAARVGRQTTGRSTAKLTAQHRLIYQRLETDRGLDKARMYADAQQAGELTTLVAKVEAIGPSAFVTDLGLLENRFQFQRYLQSR